MIGVCQVTDKNIYTRHISVDESQMDLGPVAIMQSISKYCANVYNACDAADTIC